MKHKIKNSVFCDDDLTQNILKRFLFFFDGIYVYPSAIQSGGFLNSTYRGEFIGNEIVQKLFFSNIVKIICSIEEKNEILMDKTIVGFDGSVREHIMENPKNYFYYNSLTDEENEVIKKVSQTDNKNHELKDYINKLADTEFMKKFYNPNQNIKSSYDDLFRKESTELAKKILDIRKKHTGPNFINDLTGFNKSLIFKSKYSHILQLTPLESVFYWKKFNNQNFNANKITEIMEHGIKLDIVDIPGISDLTFSQILEIRNSKHWNYAMKDLYQIVQKLKISNNITSNIQKAKEDIKNELLDSIEAVDFRKTVRKSSTNLIKGLAIGSIPIVGSIISSTIDVAEPLYEYFKKRKENSIAYFIKEMNIKFK